MEVITEKPLWFLIFCLILGVVYAFILYRKENLLNDIQPWLRKMLFALRVLSVSLISFLLLSPMIKTISREEEKPLIIIAQDNSQSVVQNKDSAFYRKEYKENLSRLVEQLEKNYTVKTLNFGEEVRDGFQNSFTEKVTDISRLFDEVEKRYTNRNTGALILATDGIYNEGTNPVYASDVLRFPIYTIAMGDTNEYKDLILSAVKANKVAYLGNKFPLEINIAARKLRGEKTILTVKKDSAVVFSKNIDISGGNFNTKIPVTLDANKKGQQHYVISLSKIPGETNNSNNIKDIFIEVLDNKEKVLILARAPHPDIASIKEALEVTQTYDVKTMVASKFEGTFNQYNLVILHEIPFRDNTTNAIIPKLKESGVSILYILGSSSGITSFNNLKTGLVITENLNRTNEAAPALSPDFNLFTLSDELTKSINTFPPLITPFGNYKISGNSFTLLKQQIGSVKTDNPLILFTDDGQTKNGFITGEGIWRWRMRNFAEKGNHDIFNELISKMVQYLSVKEKKSHFRLNVKNRFTENEPVQFEAEVYNKSYEAVNNGEVSIEIKNSSGKTFPYTFSKTEKSFSLNAGNFPPGTYSYKATAKNGNEVYTAQGNFIIAPLQLEANETVADHHLLYTLARKHGGEMVYPSNLNMLAEKILKREDIQTVSYSHKILRDLINLKWIFFLILILLSAEWFIRKQQGGY